jgi:hypothetical protein
LALSDYEQFAKTVRGLWRTGHADTGDETLKLLWSRRYASYPLGDVLRALTDHKLDNPDAMKPNWKDINVRLGQRSGSVSGYNDFEVFLEYNVRGGLDRHARKHPDRWKGQVPPKDLTRAALWQNHLDQQASDIQDSMPGKPYPDDDGRRAKAAQAMREREATCWLRYYASIGQPPPEWLSN